MATTDRSVTEAGRELSWLTLVLTSLVAALSYFIVTMVRRRHSYKDLPKPPHSFLWGHLKLIGEIISLFPEGPHWQVVITTLSQKYNLPGVWYLDLWPVGSGQMIVTDPDVALHMTVTRNHPKHVAIGDAIDPLIGKGNIVSADGAGWKKMHKMLAPAFSITHVTKMRPMVAENVMEFRTILRRLAETRETFKFEELVQRLALDIIGTAMFGHSLDAQAKGSSVMKHWEDMSRANTQLRDLWHIKFITRLSMKRQRKMARMKLDAVLTELVENRFYHVQQNEISLEKRDASIIMDLILREYLQENPENQKKIDSEFLKDALIQVRTLVVGATGTISDTLSFTYMLLSAHPKVVQKLREEHDRVFAPGIDASYQVLCAEPHKLNELDYTTNVLKETMRMYPIGSTARKEHSDGFIPYDGRQWPTKGFMILPLQHTMHMNPDIFPNPKVYDPDRYDREDFVRHAWRPFERGPRACLGQPLAMDEMKITLLLTLREFDFACVDLKPNKTPRVPWSDLDLTFGDRAFQEFVFEAKPRDGMPMSVETSNWA